MLVWIGDLEAHGLSPDVIATLRANGIATFGDFGRAGLDGRIGTLFDDDEQLGIVRAVWSWIGANFKPEG